MNGLKAFLNPFINTTPGQILGSILVIIPAAIVYLETMVQVLQAILGVFVPEAPPA